MRAIEKLKIRDVTRVAKHPQKIVIFRHFLDNFLALYDEIRREDETTLDFDVF